MATIASIKRTLVARLTPAVGASEASAMAVEILEWALGLDRTRQLLEQDRSVEPETGQRIDEVARRVVAGSPLQYVLGYAWFMGMRLKVDENVLIPRPETAELVDHITDDLARRPDLRVLDIGTGSGCIAIALARALPFAEVTATDISAGALAVAAQNARALKVKIDFVEADILKADTEKTLMKEYDVIVSNPPYIAQRERAGMDARVYEQEPAAALFVPDNDPLVFYRAIARFAGKVLAPEGALYFEINPLFVSELRVLLNAEGFGNVDIIRDYKGNYRFAICRR